MAGDYLLSVIALLKHPVVQAVQIQASLILLIGIVGWTWSGVRRGREAARLTAAGYAAALQAAAEAEGPSNDSSTRTAKPDASVGKTFVRDIPNGDNRVGNEPASSLCKDENGLEQDRRQQQQQGWRLRYRSSSSSRNRNSSSRNSQTAVAPAPSVAIRSVAVQQQQQRNQQPVALKEFTAAAEVEELGGAATSIYLSRPVGQAAAPWPPLAVVCPVKGQRQHSMDNWQTQLAAYYGGPRVFVFAVESPTDTAVAAVRDMMQQQQQQQQQCRGVQTCDLPGHVLHAWQQRPGHVVLLLDAGLATTCSQKIHNILGGIQVALAALQQQQREISSHSNVTSSSNSSSSSTDACCVAQQQQCQQQQCQQQQCQQQQCQQQQCQHQQCQHQQCQQQQCQQQQAKGMLPPGAAAAAASTAAAGTAAAGTAGYVCVLDDDVWLHPLSLQQMVDHMEAQPDLVMVTGYPFDIVTLPSATSSSSSGNSSSSSWCGQLLAYAAAAYHLPLLIGFSVADRGNFVWGGAMLLRATIRNSTAGAAAAAGRAAAAGGATGGASDKFQAVGLGGSGAAAADVLGSTLDDPNIEQVWRNGGYSDDLLLAGYCAAHGHTIGLPASAYFPQLLPPTYTTTQYWNYLRRQVYVLDTYYSAANKTLNHTMMALHSYGSLLFTGAVLSSCLQVALLLLLLLLQGPAAVSVSQGDLLPHSNWWAAALQQLAGSSSSKGVDSNIDEAAATMQSASSSRDGSDSSIAVLLWQLLCCCTTTSTWLFLAANVVSLLSIRFMVQQVLVLFRVLSPHAGSEVLNPDVSVLLLWCGWFLEHAVLPFCMLYSYCCDHIVWGGIMYHKQGGRVAKVVHLQQ